MVTAGSGSHAACLASARWAQAWAAAAAVVDPEIPVLTIADLGVLREVRVDGDVAEAIIIPTYSGCPAMGVIALDVEVALATAGFARPKVTMVLTPRWTTEFLSQAGRTKLERFGIAPPAGKVSRAALFAHDEVRCPQCGAEKAERISEFGSTPCKALYCCTACSEPFDYFKCI
jgi:ring-1,2-phenylacetyl-CoA epoxidase subunit PaaD